MRYTAVILGACLFLLINSTLAFPDELSDLKQQVEALQKKIEAMEEKQEAQAESVEKIRKQPSAYEVVSEQLGKQVTMGGHLKFFLADQSRGEVNDDSQHNSFAGGISNLWLYLSKNLTDWLQITVAPEILVEAAATPMLGANLNRSGSANVDIDLDEAYLTARLPWWQIEMRAGAFYPLFSEEYGTKAWWHEQYHANNGLPTLEAWQSLGIELYKNFDFENFSLPIYFYPFLNGEDRGVIQDKRFTDNNSAKSMLLHVTPEFFAFGSRFRLLGSAGYGRWDDKGDKDAYQWAAGADVTYSSFNLSGEYMYRWREDLPLIGGGTEDGQDQGWYVKAKYTLNPKWRFLLKYSDVELWAPGTDQLQTDHYQTISAAVNYWITDSSTIIPQIEFVDADRDGSSETLQYWRYTLGWRTTF